MDSLQSDLNKQSSDLLSQLRVKGYIIDMPDAVQYIEGVARNIFGDEANRFKFHIARLPGENAFALPDGNIIFHLSLFSAMDNESQLAFVIAHEAVHVINNHSYLGAKTRKRDRIAAHIIDIATFGTGLVYIPFLASIQENSREQESEADEIAINKVIAAGYDPRETRQFFDRLENYTSLDDRSVAFLQSHPTYNNRRDIISNNINNSNLAKLRSIDPDRYSNIQNQFLIMNIRQKIKSREYLSALLSIERGRKKSQNANVMLLFDGDLFMSMGGNPQAGARACKRFSELSEVLVCDDSETEKAEGYFYHKALDSYKRQLEIDAENNFALKGVGLAQYQLGLFDESISTLEQYLTINPNAKDKRYIKYLFSEMRK